MNRSIFILVSILLTSTMGGCGGMKDLKIPNINAFRSCDEAQRELWEWEDELERLSKTDEAFQDIKGEDDDKEDSTGSDSDEEELSRAEKLENAEEQVERYRKLVEAICG